MDLELRSRWLVDKEFAGCRLMCFGSGVGSRIVPGVSDCEK